MADDRLYGEPEQTTTQNFTADSTTKTDKKQQTNDADANAEAEKAVFVTTDNTTTFAETEKREFSIKLQTDEFWSKLKNVDTEQTEENKQNDNFWQKFITTDKAKAHLAALTKKDPNGGNEGITPLKQGDKNYDVIATRLIKEGIVPIHTDHKTLAADLRKWNEGHMPESTLSVGTLGKEGHLIGKNIYYKNPILFPASPLNNYKTRSAGPKNDPLALSVDDDEGTRMYVMETIEIPNSSGLDNYSFPAQHIEIKAIDPNVRIDSTQYNQLVQNEQDMANYQNSYVMKFLSFLDYFDFQRGIKVPKRTPKPLKGAKTTKGTKATPKYGVEPNKTGKQNPLNTTGGKDTKPEFTQAETKEFEALAEKINAIRANKSALSAEEQVAFQKLMDKGDGKSQEEFKSTIETLYQKATKKKATTE